MSGSHWEVEQKYRLVDVAATKTRLTELGVQWAEPIRQVDRYFNHPSRDFAQTDEALRLRQVGGENVITYKGPKIDLTTKTRRELELPLPAGQTVPEQFGEILVALGFRAAVCVEKVRLAGWITWEGCQVEVALDVVETLGDFLELEVSADNDSLDTAKRALLSLAERLEVHETERRGYADLIARRLP